MTSSWVFDVSWLSFYSIIIFFSFFRSMSCSFYFYFGCVIKNKVYFPLSLFGEGFSSFISDF